MMADQELATMRDELDQLELAAMQADVAALAGGTKEPNAAPRPRTWQDFRPERHEISVLKLATWPREQISRAEWGVTFVKRVFPSLAKADVDVKWFAGVEAGDLDGLFEAHRPTVVWIKFGLEPQRTVEVAAHETVHLAGFRDEAVATMIGRLAARDWAGQVKVFHYVGAPPERWWPDGLKAGFVPPGAVVLGRVAGRPTTFVNAGSPAHPKWSEAVIADLVA